MWEKSPTVMIITLTPANNRSTVANFLLNLANSPEHHTFNHKLNGLVGRNQLFTNVLPSDNQSFCTLWYLDTSLDRERIVQIFNRHSCHWDTVIKLRIFWIFLKILFKLTALFFLQIGGSSVRSPRELFTKRASNRWPGRFAAGETRALSQPWAPETDVIIFKIFSPKNLAKKLAFFYSKQSKIMQKFDHYIGI
jgi:hypothetical protein